MMCNDSSTASAGGSTPPVLVGRVTNAAGDPVPNAIVTFGANSPTHQDMGQLTNDDGVFFYPTLVAGSYELLVNDPNGVQVKLNVNVDAAAPQNLRIILPSPPTGSD